MFKTLELFHMAQSLAQHATARQAIVAENLANADTPKFRSLTVSSFQETYVSSSDFNRVRETRSGHLLNPPQEMEIPTKLDRSATVKPNGNSVSLEGQIMESALSKQQHDLALSIYRSGMNVLRASLGRG